MSAKVRAVPLLEAGFTLIEMLVVVTILASVATLSMPLLSRSPDGLRLRTVSNDLAAALRVTRSSAIRHNSETTLVMDVDRRVYHSAAGPVRSFARDIDAKLTFASGISVGRADGGFHFFPDGSSTGGTVTLSLHGKEEKLCVQWLTGEIRQGIDC
jgi:general secretion pathway protein H